MTITLRPVRWTDCLWCWRLRNDVAWRKGASSIARVPLRVHLAWFRRRLSDPLPWWTIRHVAVAGTRLGLLRLDGDDLLLVPDIGVTIAVTARWRRHGVARAALGMMQARLPGLILAARVRTSNRASLDLFEQAAGWRRGGIIEKDWRMFHNGVSLGAGRSRANG